MAPIISRVAPTFGRMSEAIVFVVVAECRCGEAVGGDPQHLKRLRRTDIRPGDFQKITIQIRPTVGATR